MKVVTVSLNPAIDRTLGIPGFACGKVNKVKAEQSNVGGKGINVASVLADLGEVVVVTGFLGMDNPLMFEDLFARKHIDDRFVRIQGETRTSIKIVDPSTGVTTDVNFPGLAPSRGDLDDLTQRLVSLAGEGDWFVLTGSLPPGVSPDIYRRFTELLRPRRARILLDASGEALREAVTAGPDVVKPNLHELEELLGRTLDGPAQVRDAARSLLAQGVGLCIVSMGPQGAVFVDRERALWARPPAVTVASTVGAGDALVAAVVHALRRGLPLEACARAATAMGAFAVSRVGPGLDDRAAWEALGRDTRVEALD